MNQCGEGDDHAYGLAGSASKAPTVFPLRIMGPPLVRGSFSWIATRNAARGRLSEAELTKAGLGALPASALAACQPQASGNAEGDPKAAAEGLATGMAAADANPQEPGVASFRSLAPTADDNKAPHRSAMESGLAPVGGAAAGADADTATSRAAAATPSLDAVHGLLFRSGLASGTVSAARARPETCGTSVSDSAAPASSHAPPFSKDASLHSSSAHPLRASHWQQQQQHLHQQLYFQPISRWPACSGTSTGRGKQQPSSQHPVVCSPASVISAAVPWQWAFRPQEFACLGSHASACQHFVLPPCCTACNSWAHLFKYRALKLCHQRLSIWRSSQGRQAASGSDIGACHSKTI